MVAATQRKGCILHPFALRGRVLYPTQFALFCFSLAFVVVHLITHCCMSVACLWSMAMPAWTQKRIAVLHVLFTAAAKGLSRLTQGVQWLYACVCMFAGLACRACCMHTSHQLSATMLLVQGVQQQRMGGLRSKMRAC